MENAEVKVCEHFIDFIPVEQTTGAALTYVILQMLTQTGIPIEDRRGQGYDNVANMRGHQSGVQKKILEKNSRAFFVPCHGHSLNFFVNDAAKSSREAEAYFEMVHYISYDLPSRHEAVLAQKTKNFKFCCSTVIWFNTLNQVNLASKVIQNIEIDISEAKQTLNKNVNFLKLYRSDEAFEKVISDAELIAAELDLEPSFSFEVSISSRFKKQMLSYETRDDPIINPKDRFKIECFKGILDSAINSIEKRFNHLNEYCDAFKFLTGTSANIDGMELLDELLALSELIEPKASPLKVLEFFLRNNHFTPNVSIALQILLTQLVSV
ncbi:uncharacterized protein LOC136090033 [Hydra vulgaris]|uniref:Uncharacterized protein LOC136090033 n=1 Tax=Hydra vulgaris TaxID=6087 RepID=A0ABM4DCT3_HYDVU